MKELSEAEQMTVEQTEDLLAQSWWEREAHPVYVWETHVRDLLAIVKRLREA